MRAMRVRKSSAPSLPAPSVNRLNAMMARPAADGRMGIDARADRWRQMT